MSSTEVASSGLTRQAIAATDRSAKLQVTGKLRKAIDAMVWLGARRAQAASEAGITDHSLRAALSKPHVKAYYRTQLDVLRNSERAKNIHRLAQIRDKADNMPAVNAIKVLEQIDEQATQASGNTAQSPGLVIVINGPPGSAVTAHQRVIEPDPIDSAPQDDRGEK